MDKHLAARQKLAQTVNPNRSLLIKRFVEHYPGNTSAAIRHLTDIAVQAGYIPPRTPPLEIVLAIWPRKNEAPAWACRAAFDFLIKHGWAPRSEIEKALTARYVLMNQYPNHPAWQKVLGDWWSLAQQAELPMSQQTVRD